MEITWSGNLAFACGGLASPFGKCPPNNTRTVACQVVIFDDCFRLVRYRRLFSGPNGGPLEKEEKETTMGENIINNDEIQVT